MRLIDADALLTFMRKGWRVFPSSELRHTCDITDIENAPTIDAEPVKRGHWINISISANGYESSAECDLCGAIVHNNFSSIINYCPNCGAKMDEDRDYERAVEQLEHDMTFEPTYNPEDGSM